MPPGLEVPWDIHSCDPVEVEDGLDYPPGTTIACSSILLKIVPRVTCRSYAAAGNTCTTVVVDQIVVLDGGRMAAA